MTYLFHFSHVLSLSVSSVDEKCLLIDLVCIKNREGMVKLRYQFETPDEITFLISNH